MVNRSNPLPNKNWCPGRSRTDDQLMRCGGQGAVSINHHQGQGVSPHIKVKVSVLTFCTLDFFSNYVITASSPRQRKSGPKPMNCEGRQLIPVRASVSPHSLHFLFSSASWIRNSNCPSANAPQSTPNSSSRCQSSLFALWTFFKICHNRFVASAKKIWPKTDEVARAAIDTGACKCLQVSVLTLCTLDFFSKFVITASSPRQRKSGPKPMNCQGRQLIPVRRKVQIVRTDTCTLKILKNSCPSQENRYE